MRSGAPLIDAPCHAVALEAIKSDTMPRIHTEASIVSFQPLVQRTVNLRTMANQELHTRLPELEHRKRNVNILRRLTKYAIHNVSPAPSLPTFRFHCLAPHPNFPMNMERAQSLGESHQVRSPRKHSKGSMVEQAVSSMSHGDMVNRFAGTHEQSPSTTFQQKRPRHNRSHHAEFAIELSLATIQPSIEAVHPRYFSRLRKGRIKKKTNGKSHELALDCATSRFDNGNSTPKLCATARWRIHRSYTILYFRRRSRL
ncbi:hypothetical protein BC830DRAFT_368668 [Chytriomyces sp. MP71]|nr:hypothetical protein BC830DRAFT_368668 [Chytriomyces sp. MP71]